MRPTSVAKISKEKNKHGSKKLKARRGAVGKTAVVGMKGRETNRVTAEAIENADGLTLKEFVLDQVVDEGLHRRTRRLSRSTEPPSGQAQCG